VRWNNTPLAHATRLRAVMNIRAPYRACLDGVVNPSLRVRNVRIHHEAASSIATVIGCAACVPSYMRYMALCQLNMSVRVRFHACAMSYACNDRKMMSTTNQGATTRDRDNANWYPTSFFLFLGHACRLYFTRYGILGSLVAPYTPPSPVVIVRVFPV